MAQLCIPPEDNKKDTGLVEKKKKKEKETLPHLQGKKFPKCD